MWKTIFMQNKRDFFLECYDLGIIKFGQFTLKSGIQSPFYVDLRPLASDPKILKSLAEHLLSLTEIQNSELICGVPYAALPMATAMSLRADIPLIIKRKEAKAYGTKKLIEGIYKAGQKCLVVEDVITSGKSLLETIPEIESEGVKVSEIVVVLDREQGGKQLLENQGYKVSALFTISEAVEILHQEGKINADEVLRIKDFIAGNPISFEKKRRLTYQQKLETAAHPAAKKLLEIAIEKQTNLIASADLLTTKELLAFAEKVGPHIAALKTHIDILSDFSFDETIYPLRNLAQKHNFLLMEDRKFADIGSTQELQYAYGTYQISAWADLITAHLIAGEKSADLFMDTGVVAILSMSSEGALTDDHYFGKAVEIAQKHHNILGGVSQKSLPEDLLHFTPGINLETSGDGKGQQYNTPHFAFQNLGTDFIIVGRGIYKNPNPEQAALEYKIAGWKAYEESAK